VKLYKKNAKIKRDVITSHFEEYFEKKYPPKTQPKIRPK
jgi:CRISPR/Cas system CMR subunit Cmr6 (Cas7 group RAMP superfamily)